VGSSTICISAISGAGYHLIKKNLSLYRREWYGKREI
jgi:hypothetical protein